MGMKILPVKIKSLKQFLFVGIKNDYRIPRNMRFSCLVYTWHPIANCKEDLDKTYIRIF